MANNNRGRVPEQERCKGTSRQSKERCKRRRSPGSEYCIFHGGRVPKGGTHPNFRDGSRSKFMPQPEVLQNYLRHLGDPELTHHRDSIALVDALVDEALEDYEDGGTPELWRGLKAAWRRVEKASTAALVFGPIPGMDWSQARASATGMSARQSSESAPRRSEMARSTACRRGAFCSGQVTPAMVASTSAVGASRSAAQSA